MKRQKVRAPPSHTAAAALGRPAVSLTAASVRSVCVRCVRCDGLQRSELAQRRLSVESALSARVDETEAAESAAREAKWTALREEAERRCVCTLVLTGTEPTPQRHFVCATCRDVAHHADASLGMGVCTTCSTACHAGHSLEESEQAAAFYCECGLHTDRCRALKATASPASAAASPPLPPSPRWYSVEEAANAVEALKAECRRSGGPFVDAAFPHSTASLFLDPARPHQPAWLEAEWVRVGAVFSAPALFVPPLSADDIRQGSIGNCIAEGTLVALANGTSIPIEEVQEGADALSYHAALAPGETEGLIVRQVDAVLDQGRRECVELLFSDGRTLVCTPDHRIRTADRRWVAACKLLVGTDEVAVGAESPHVMAGAEAASEEALYDRVKVLPLFKVRLVGRRDVGVRRVFDLSVPNPQGDRSRSFVAGGVVVHNWLVHVRPGSADAAMHPRVRALPHPDVRQRWRVRGEVLPGTVRSAWWWWTTSSRP